MTEYNKLNHWYGWNGGECPLYSQTEIEATTSEACMFHGKADDFSWDDDEYPLIAFRITKLAREPREVRLSKDEHGNWIHTQLDSGILFREVIDD